VGLVSAVADMSRFLLDWSRCKDVAAAGAPTCVAQKTSLRYRGSIFLRQAVDLAADMQCLGRRGSQSDRLVERLVRSMRAPELYQQRTAHTEEIEIAGEPRCQRFDHVQRRLRTPKFRNGNRAVQGDHRRGLALQGIAYVNDRQVREVTGSWRNIDGRYLLRFIPPHLSAAFSRGREFVHVRL